MLSKTSYIGRDRKLLKFSSVIVAGIALSCLPVTCSADATDADITDPKGIATQFAEQLGKMFESGKPVAPSRLNKDLPDERLFPFRTVPTSDEVKQATDLYATCRKSVVVVGKIVKCANCDDWHANTATGFVIGSQGIVVTNHHVIADDDGAAAIGVRTWDGRMFAIQKVLAVSKKNDLAVLKIDADDLEPLPVAKLAPVGTRVFVISHPVKNFYTMTDGMVSARFLRRRSKSGNARQEMAITADYAKGSSGAPVIDSTGAVVGIVRATEPIYYDRKGDIKTNIQMVWKFCVPSSALVELLREPAGQLSQAKDD